MSEKKIAPVDSVVDTLMTSLFTINELARGVLDGRRTADELKKAALIAHFRAQLAFGVLYDLIDSPELSPELVEALKGRLNQNPDLREQAIADADAAVEILEHLYNGTATIVDLTAVKGAKA